MEPSTTPSVTEDRNMPLITRGGKHDRAAPWNTIVCLLATIVLLQAGFLMGLVVFTVKAVGALEVAAQLAATRGEPLPRGIPVHARAAPTEP